MQYIPKLKKTVESNGQFAQDVGKQNFTVTVRAEMCLHSTCMHENESRIYCKFAKIARNCVIHLMLILPSIYLEIGGA